MTATWINPEDEYSQRTAQPRSLHTPDNDGWVEYLTDGWVEIVKRARADRAERVARRPANALSLNAAARDYGLVPHPESTIKAPHGCLSCPRAQNRQRNAAAIIQFERNHPVVSIWHTTAWAMAR